MKEIINYADAYSVSYYDIPTDHEAVTLKFDYPLLNGRNTQVTLLYDAVSKRVAEVVTDLTILSLDLQELSQLQWMVGFHRDRTFYQRKVPKIVFHSCDHEYDVIAFVPSIKKEAIGLQIRDFLEEVSTLGLITQKSLLKRSISQMKRVKCDTVEIPFLTFTQYIKLYKNNPGKSEDKGLAYASYYQELRTLTHAASMAGKKVKFVSPDNQGKEKERFRTHDFLIEAIHNKPQPMIGKNDKKTLMITMHSHRPNHSHFVDFMMFNYFDKEQLEKQWIVYMNPEKESIPDLKKLILPTILTLIDFDVDTIEFASEIHPIGIQKQMLEN